MQRHLSTMFEIKKEKKYTKEISDFEHYAHARITSLTVIYIILQVH